MPPIGALMQLVAYGAHDSCFSTYKQPTRKEFEKKISKEFSYRINSVCNRINIVPNRKYLNFNITSKNKNGFNTSNGIKTNKKNNKLIYKKHIKTFN